MLRADILDFFASIDHELLVTELAVVLADTEAAEMVRSWVGAPTPTDDDLRLCDRGLPEGAPVSPALANAYLRSFDSAVHGRRGGRIVVLRDRTPVVSAPVALVSEAVLYVELRRRQLVRGGDEDARLEPSHAVITGKISNPAALLRETVFGAIIAAGLDPYLPFLHEPMRARSTLAFDLMEEWRPVLLEPTVLSLPERSAGRVVRGSDRRRGGGGSRAAAAARRPAPRVRAVRVLPPRLAVAARRSTAGHAARPPRTGVEVFPC